MLSSHFVSLRKQVQQVERDNDERSSIPITIRYVLLTIYRRLPKVTSSASQATRGYHPDIRIARQTHSYADSATVPRRRGNPVIQMQYNGRSFRGFRGWSLSRRAERRDEQDRERNSTSVADRVEYELSELGPRVCDAAGVFESCPRADIVYFGEERSHSVLGTGNFSHMRS